MPSDWIQQLASYGTVIGQPRRFVADGEPWAVAELATDGRPWARRERCLVFMSDRLMRRVWDYPDTWRALSDAELFAVSWGR